MSSLSLISRNGRKSPRIMHGRLIEKISWSTCGRHVTLWHRSAFENRIVTTNSSMIKPPFLRAFGYHSDKIGRYSFSLAGRLGSEVPGGYARPLETRTRMDCQHIKSDMQVFSPPLSPTPASLVCIWQQMLRATAVLLWAICTGVFIWGLSPDSALISHKPSKTLPNKCKPWTHVVEIMS